MRIKQHVTFLRGCRKIHRWTGISLFIFFIVVSVTGLFLGWKKNSYGLILPETQSAEDVELYEWLPISEIAKAASTALYNHTGIAGDTIVDRIDVRPDKGIAKVKFTNNYYGVQVNGETGEVLQIATRYSDLIESIHDGSILDTFIPNPLGIFKLLFTNILSLALFVFIGTGLWLWYGPKYIRKLKNNR